MWSLLGGFTLPADGAVEFPDARGVERLGVHLGLLIASADIESMQQSLDHHPAILIIRQIDGIVQVPSIAAEPDDRTTDPRVVEQLVHHHRHLPGMIGFIMGGGAIRRPDRVDVHQQPVPMGHISISGAGTTLGGDHHIRRRFTHRLRHKVDTLGTGLQINSALCHQVDVAGIEESVQDAPATKRTQLGNGSWSYKSLKVNRNTSYIGHSTPR